MEEQFKITTYGFKDLALMYNPGVQPESAVKTQSRWIHRNQQMIKELQAVGWNKRTRLFTPSQVAIIIRHLEIP